MRRRFTGWRSWAFLEYLTSGITAAFDMYLIPDAVGKAARDFGFRTVLVGAMNKLLPVAGG